MLRPGVGKIDATDTDARFLVGMLGELAGLESFSPLPLAKEDKNLREQPLEFL